MGPECAWKCAGIAQNFHIVVAGQACTSPEFEYSTWIYAIILKYWYLSHRVRLIFQYQPQIGPVSPPDSTTHTLSAVAVLLLIFFWQVAATLPHVPK